MGPGRTTRLIEEADGWWTAIHEETGIASQGQTRESALENLDSTLLVTAAARTEDSAAPEPDAPWFEA